MSVLRLDGIGKSHGKISILDDVTLTVDSGEFCVLLGASGSGKSTLLKIVAGLEAPSRGRVLLDGGDITPLPPDQRSVAMVFQSYALYPTMTVAQNIGFCLKTRGIAAVQVEKRVTAMARRLEISHLLDRRPAKLSGGQQQRVALARALIRESAILALDEPLSSLDAALRGSMRAEIKRLHQLEGRTTLYVTHDQTEAMTLGDRVAVLDAGRLLQFDPPEIVYARPNSLRVASLVGAPGMNFVNGVLEAVNGQVVLNAAGESWPLSGFNLGAGALGGRRAALGFRPEHARLLPSQASVGILASVAMIEHTGPDCYAIATLSSGQINVRLTPGQSFARDAAVRVAVDHGKAHLFCLASGARLSS
jgi:multiple sugar transport system ATP-binding protein